MSAPMLRFAAVGFLAAGGCNLTVRVFPSAQCPPRNLIVEIPPDPPGAVPTYEHPYHAAAGCTLFFDARQYHLSTTFEHDPRWEPISGLDYELRIVPVRDTLDQVDPAQDRIESGVLPSDGRLIVATTSDDAAVWLTVFVPDTRFNKIDREIAVVYLD